MAVLSRRERTAESRRATESALLDAVVELVDEGAAFADLPIEQIVSRAGFSRPTFYAYFRDKRDLVMRLGEDLGRDLEAATRSWFSLEADAPDTTLRAVLEVFRSHSATVAMVTEAATYDHEVAEFWRGLHDAFVPGAVQRIRSGFPDLGDQAGQARAFALVWMTQQSLTEHLARPTVDEDVLLDQLSWLWSLASGLPR